MERYEPRTYISGQLQAQENNKPEVERMTHKTYIAILQEKIGQLDENLKRTSQHTVSVNELAPSAVRFLMPLQLMN